jgi:uncharacterized protein (TIGR02186 family)
MAIAPRASIQRTARLGALLFVLALVVLPARAEDLVLTLSTREVAITSTYTGAEVTVFGLIERDAQTISRAGAYEVVASVSGPPGDLVLQQKDRFGPIWLTAARKRYEKIPLFFSILSGRAIAEAVTSNVRERLKLGLEYHLPPITAQAPAARDDERAFREAALRLQSNNGMLTEDQRAISMVRPNVFTAKVNLPATAPVGLYLVNITVLSEGVPLKTAQAGFVVRKVGFDAYISVAARNEPLSYGIFTILMAIFLGWLANLVFRKD